MNFGVSWLDHFSFFFTMGTGGSYLIVWFVCPRVSFVWGDIGGFFVLFWSPQSTRSCCVVSCTRLARTRLGLFRVCVEMNGEASRGFSCACSSSSSRRKRTTGRSQRSALVALPTGWPPARGCDPGCLFALHDI